MMPAVTSTNFAWERGYGNNPRRLKAEVSCFQLGHERHNRGDQRISRRFVYPYAIAAETLAAEVLSESALEVGEGVFGAFGGRITAQRRL